MELVEDLNGHLRGLISQGLSPLELVVVEEHPTYRGELMFQVIEGEAAFYARYREWISPYLVLNEIFNYPAFVKQLETDGWTVIFDRNTLKILTEWNAWARSLIIGDYTLYPFQQFSLRRAFENHFWFFNWDTGAGKSFTCAAGAKYLLDNDMIDQVIACTMPKSKIDMRRFFDNAQLVACINDGTKAKRTKVYQEGHQVYVMNYEKLRVDEPQITQLITGRNVLWIFDECHKLVTGDEKQNLARRAFERMSVLDGPGSKIWPMSASVVDGNPLRFRDLFSIGQHNHNPLGGLAQFERDYADEVRHIELKTKNNKSFTITDYDWNLTKLTSIRHRVGDRTQTARKTDPGIREHFKGIQTLTVDVQRERDEIALADAITDLAYEAWCREESLGPYYDLLRATANTPLAIHATNSEVAEPLKGCFDLMKMSNSKLDKINEKLVEIREQGDKVLLFTHWTSLTMHLIREDQIEVPHVRHYGVGQSEKVSQAAKERFWDDPNITCFFTSDAGAHGLNMQCARFVLQMDPTYSYDTAKQRAARIDRSDSHLDGLTNFVMITEGSVEERVWDVQNARRIISSAVQGTTEVHSYSPKDIERAKASESANYSWLIFGEKYQ